MLSTPPSDAENIVFVCERNQRQPGLTMGEPFCTAGPLRVVSRALRTLLAQPSPRLGVGWKANAIRHSSVEGMGGASTVELHATERYDTGRMRVRGEMSARCGYEVRCPRATEGPGKLFWWFLPWTGAAQARSQ